MLFLATLQLSLPRASSESVHLPTLPSPNAATSRRDAAFPDPGPREALVPVGPQCRGYACFLLSDGSAAHRHMRTVSQALTLPALSDVSGHKH